MYEDILLGFLVFLVCLKYKKSKENTYVLPKSLLDAGIKSLIGFYLVLWNAKFEDGLHIFEKCLNKLNGIFYINEWWLSPNGVCFFSKSEYAKVLFSGRNHIRKPAFGYEFVDMFKNGLIGNSGEKWRVHKTLVHHLFSTKNLSNFQPVFNKAAANIVEEFKTKADGRSFYCDAILNGHLFNSVVENICGLPYSPLSIQERNAFLEEIEYETDYTTWLYMHYYVINIFKLFPSLFRRKKFSKTVDRIINKLVEAKKNYPDDPENECYMTKMSVLNHEDFIGEMKTMLIVGYTTSSATLSITLAFLAMHPEEQTLVYNELFDIFGDSDRQVEYHDFSKMRRLEACINEALRLCPTIPGVARELDHDVKIGEFTIPKDTSVVLLMTSFHRDESVWVKPNEFYPDHFYNTEIANKRPPFSFLPFSTGPRQCIGMRYAKMSLKTKISAILRTFHLETDMKIGDMRTTRSIVHDPRDIHIKLFPRNNNNNNISH